MAGGRNTARLAFISALFFSLHVKSLICKFKQNEVTSSNIGKSEEETSRGTDKPKQMSNDAKRKSQEDIKGSSAEKETKTEQISKKDATDLVDDQVKVTNNTLNAVDALVNAVITSKVEVDEAPKSNCERKPGVRIDNKNNSPTTALISSLTNNKVVISSDQENAEKDDCRIEVIEGASDDDVISRGASQNNTREENRTEGDLVSPEEMNEDSDSDAQSVENKKVISIGEVGLVRESSTDIEPDCLEDQQSEDVEFSEEVKAELDKLDVFLDDEASNSNLTENQNDEEHKCPDVTSETNTQDQNENKLQHVENEQLNENVLGKVTEGGDQDVLFKSTKNVSEDEKENANEAVVIIGGQTEAVITAENTAKDDLSEETSTGDAEAGSECQVGPKGCTFACVPRGSSKAHEPRLRMWMERHVLSEQSRWIVISYYRINFFFLTVLA